MSQAAFESIKFRGNFFWRAGACAIRGSRLWVRWVNVLNSKSLIALLLSNDIFNQYCILYRLLSYSTFSTLEDARPFAVRFTDIYIYLSIQYI